MLKIEVIKFEAQDIITASTATPRCICGDYCDNEDHNGCPAPDDQHHCELRLPC